jgi:hypothetical protein
MFERGWILLPSGKQLDLLNPDPWAWIDDDLAVGLSRTYRWAGYSTWDLPLSVGEHSLGLPARRRSRFALCLWTRQGVNCCAMRPRR